MTGENEARLVAANDRLEENAAGLDRGGGGLGEGAAQVEPDGGARTGDTRDAQADRDVAPGVGGVVERLLLGVVGLLLGVVVRRAGGELEADGDGAEGDGCAAEGEGQDVGAMGDLGSGARLGRWGCDGR